MKTTTLLKISSVLSALYCVGHTLGRPWTPAKAMDAQSVVQAMKAVHFDAMGASRSYWDFYYGFGLSLSIYMLVQSVLLWQLALIAKTDPRRIRPLIGAVLLSYIASLVIVWNHFFILPVIFTVVIALTLLWAFLAAGRRDPELARELD